MAEYLTSRGGKLPEKWARWYFLQMWSGLRHCHSLKVYNRDVKPGNLLLYGRDQLMVADFGLSKCPDAQGELASNVGSTLYKAPEVYETALQDANGRYDGAKADVFSAGVTLYEMVLGGHPFCFIPPDGTTPFNGDVIEHRRQLYANKMAGRWWPEGRPWAADTDLRSLLDGMLQPQPSKRLDLEQVLAHPWTRRDVKAPVLEHLDRQPAEPTQAEQENAARGKQYMDALATWLRDVWQRLR